MKGMVLSVGLLLLTLLAGGCDTPGGGSSAPRADATAGAQGTSAQAVTNEDDASIDFIHVGDRVTVNYADIPNPPTPMEQRVRDDGTITLALDQQVQAAGKRAGDLEKEIRALYVPKYFVRLTVSVKPEGRFIYVGGQVRKPDRYVHEGNMTVLKAIKMAGDFTDYANKRKVTLTRADKEKTKITIDCIKAQKNAKLDVRVFPGDEINVIQRHF